jgi:hypothetical protein
VVEEDFNLGRKGGLSAREVFVMPGMRMSLRVPFWVAGSSAVSCALIWLGWGIYLYWNDIRLVNFLAAWIPFVLSTLIAFVPEHKMTKAKKAWWRTSVIAVGFAWSLVLWHQQLIADETARADQLAIVTKAVTQSNAHSDEKIGEVRQDVQGVKTDVLSVKQALSTSTSSLNESIGKVRLPASEKAAYEVSLWPATITEWPIRRQSLPIVNGVVTFSFTIQIKGHMAKQTRLWLRLCKGCKYAKEPSGFQNLTAHAGKGDDPNERMLVVGDFLPNVAFTPVDVGVIPPVDQNFFLVGVLVGCENCDPVDPDHPQILRVDIQR